MSSFFKKKGQFGIVHLSIPILLAVFGILTFLLIASSASFKNNIFSILFPKQFSKAAAGITNITDNSSSYPNSQIPKYEKFEATFNVATTAENLQLPYEASPPAGIKPGIGVTVNGEFSQDNFVTKVTIPAFYYQNFDYQVKGTQEWFYPTSNYSWKLRFAPDKEGAWQYRITATDASGTSSSITQSFTVVSNPNSHGFVKVSKKDPRYFEYDDGTYFPAQGYNMTYGMIGWDNPVLSNQANFQKMGQNGIQLLRNWLSDWGIFASDDQPWTGVAGNPPSNNPGVSVPYISSGGTSVPIPVVSNADVAFRLQKYWNPCLFYGGWHDISGPAVKQNTKYKILIRYLIPQALPPAVDTTKPFGLVAKIAPWLDAPLTNPNNSCTKPGLGTEITQHVNQISAKDGGGNFQWQILEGTIDPSFIGTKNFLGRIYLSMDNIDHTIVGAGEQIFIDRIEIREDLGDNLCAASSGSGLQFDLSNGKCGTNIMTAPWSGYNQYFNQRFSQSLDKVLDLAHQNNVYLKLTILEKNEYIQNHIDFTGKTILDNQPGCVQPDGRTACPGLQVNTQWFYGDYRNMTKTRWLQQAYWRYLQARWGYSTNIHSWELLNEGDPFNGRHWAQTDELGKYMHQFGQNSHLVTTSTWHSFPQGPGTELWGNPNYPNLDYADVHQYMMKDQTINLRTDKNAQGAYQLGASVNVLQPQEWFDSAAATNKISQAIGAKQLYGIGKPIMRGETGFVLNNSNGWNSEVRNDTTGVWLHKFIWGGINPGGLIESYWYTGGFTGHIYPGSPGQFPTYDNRPEFGKYYNFIKDIPLSNGNYQDASASATDSNLRVWGQKDTVNKRAHIWIDNKTHTWGNVVYATPSATISTGTKVTIPNMPSGSYPVSWIDTYASPSASLIKTETVNVGTDGNLVLTLFQNLTKDIAVKIGNYLPSPTPTPGPKQGDINGDNKIDIIDLSILLSKWNSSDASSDLNKDGKVSIIDLSILLSNWGK